MDWLRLVILVFGALHVAAATTLAFDQQIGVLLSLQAKAAIVVADAVLVFVNTQLPSWRDAPVATEAARRAIRGMRYRAPLEPRPEDAPPRG